MNAIILASMLLYTSNPAGVCWVETARGEDAGFYVGYSEEMNAYIVVTRATLFGTSSELDDRCAIVSFPDEDNILMPTKKVLGASLGIPIKSQTCQDWEVVLLGEDPGIPHASIGTNGEEAGVIYVIGGMVKIDPSPLNAEAEYNINRVVGILNTNQELSWVQCGGMGASIEWILEEGGVVLTKPISPSPLVVSDSSTNVYLLILAWSAIICGLCVVVGGLIIWGRCIWY